MKASRWNPADILVYAVLFVGAMGTGLMGFLGPGGFDLVSEPFGSLMVFSLMAGFVGAMGVLYQLAWLQNNRVRGHVRVRA
jgi:uncharacterized membrane protein YuzA (DUF378 family)